MGWVEYFNERGAKRGESEMFYVTMNPKGDIAISRATWKLMRHAAGFVLLYDPDLRRIGLKPSQHCGTGAHPARSYGQSGGRILRAAKFLKELNIDLPKTVQFIGVEKDKDGILVLDLATARVPLRVSGHYRNRGEREVGPEPW